MSESDDAAEDAQDAPGQERTGTYTRHRAARRSLSDAEYWNSSAPELEISETEVGRETLGAIAGELRTDAPRSPMATAPYGDRISNAPGAPSPRRATGTSAPTRSRPRDTSAPEITIGREAAGRETLAAITEELRAERSEQPDTRIRQRATPGAASVPRPADRKDPDHPDMPAKSERRGAISVSSQPLAVYEMATFVVRCDPVHLASNHARRRFVEERLLHRLPVDSMDLVDRIDVTPWTVRDTLIVRVWCTVPPP